MHGAIAERHNADVAASLLVLVNRDYGTVPNGRNMLR